MKRRNLRVLILVLTLILVQVPLGYALNFTGQTGNAATFETLQEAHANSVSVVAEYFENDTKTFIGHPVLDDYPLGTTFIYRSPNMYGGRAAARLNTNIFVYTDKHFEDKNSAYEYLEQAGLINIINEATGSIVLITPIGEAFTQEDVSSYYALQTAMLSQKGFETTENGEQLYYADAEYFGGYGYIYFIGVDGGATFFNNYVSTTFDFCSRIAGALLVGGEMEEIRKPSVFIPVYLVNAREDIIAKYNEANQTDAILGQKDVITHYKQDQPLRKVVVENVGTVDLALQIKNAYYNMFIKAMRVPVGPQAIHSAGTPYSGYNFDEAPYSLCDRSMIINGVTNDGIHLFAYQGDSRFDGIKTEEGEYIDTWYEYLPEEAINGTASNASIPLILANHGGGDDPRVFVEEFGLLELAGQERIAIVAPDHQTIADIRGPALTAVVDYMLERYPALDPARVYATGYSMGGAATYVVGNYKPGMFAAIAPIAGSPTPAAEGDEEKFANCDLPVFFAVSSYDGVRRLTGFGGSLNEASMEMVTYWARVNGIKQEDYDFDKYPIIGFEGDSWVIDKVNHEHEVNTWYLNNDAGEPRIAFAYVKGMIHALYPEYARMGWDFMKHYSRDLETGAVVYNPYVR